MKLRILILFLSMTAVLGACRSTETVSDPFFQPTEADMLTKEETESIIWHAKNFITSNKNLRLGKNHRKMIQDNAPVTRIVYSGKKHGRIELEWPISSDTVVLLSSRGDLLSKRQPWMLEILSGKQKGGLSDAELEQWRNVDTADEFEAEESGGAWETLGVEPIPVIEDTPAGNKED
ncbi:MAG: hypothetical protein IKC53_05660 [Lentisphaeria bacterium]|nr:hypothetical protein [Lentisphaeria bacterium]